MQKFVASGDVSSQPEHCRQGANGFAPYGALGTMRCQGSNSGLLHAIVPFELPLPLSEISNLFIFSGATRPVNLTGAGGIGGSYHRDQ